MTTVNIYASEHIRINQGAPNQNYGGESAWRVYQGPTSDVERGLVKFDLSSIPAGSTINSVTLYIPKNNSGFGTIPAYCKRITDNSWSEYGTTWNNQPATTDTNQVSYTIPQGSGTFNITVSAQVQDAWAAGTTYSCKHIANPESGSGNAADFSDSTYITVDYTPNRDHVYVNSSTGNNSNDGGSCTSGHPYLTFAQAYSVMNSGGTIHVCNSGADFSGENITYTKPLSIQGPDSGNYYLPKFQ